MKRLVRIVKKQVQVGSKRIPLISGEVHYWRLNPKYWGDILGQVKDLGLNVISTYVPWDYHEPKRGRFDFTGKTDETRNLKKFLELTRREGFWVVIRPGPYIYSEWPNEGVPPYAYRYHRLHPRFLKYAENYIRKVSAVLKPFLASRGSGHIILLQADNEIDPWPDVFGQQYGLNGKPGMFQEFLSQKYNGNIRELNRLWATQYRTFKEVGPYIACMFQGEHGLILKGDPELRRNLDYFEFKYDYTYRCAKWNVEMYRKVGIDIPIYLNLYPFFYAHDWSKMQSAADMVGVDLYPSNELSENEHEQRKMIDKIRFLRNISSVPYIAEFSSGVWHNRHYESGTLTPTHYRLITLSALLGGVGGWNWYMLVNRDNWYMSPINEWGRNRPELYSVFKQLVALFKEMKPYLLTHCTDIGVTFNPLQYAARTLSSDNRVLVALSEADIDYDLFDPAHKIPRKKIIFYSGNQWLSRKAHQALRAYVEAGGILVAFQDYPRKDENFAPCDIIGFHEPDRILFEFRRGCTLSLNAGSTVKLNTLVFSFHHTAGEPVQADFDRWGRHNIGYLKTVGKGKILHLGVEPKNDLLIEILRFFNVPVYVRSATKDVKTALFHNGDRYYVVAVNNGRESKNVQIAFDMSGKTTKRATMKNICSLESDGCILSRDHRSFSTELPRKDGRVFRIKFK